MIEFAERGGAERPGSFGRAEGGYESDSCAAGRQPRRWFPRFAPPGRVWRGPTRAGDVGRIGMPVGRRMGNESPPARSSGNEQVVEHALGEIRTFIDELKNGTRKYKTIASLGGQIAEAYRGRCVLELLQNAHDALADTPGAEPGLITFTLETAPDPVLLIANSGRPFEREDFKGLCQLGQSPKDPNKSVGNKGLGFRSVLEVTSAPEIWSSASTEEWRTSSGSILGSAVRWRRPSRRSTTTVSPRDRRSTRRCRWSTGRRTSSNATANALRRNAWTVPARLGGSCLRTTSPCRSKDGVRWSTIYCAAGT